MTGGGYRRFFILFGSKQAALALSVAALHGLTYTVHRSTNSAIPRRLTCSAPSCSAYDALHALAGLPPRVRQLGANGRPSIDLYSQPDPASIAARCLACPERQSLLQHTKSEVKASIGTTYPDAGQIPDYSAQYRPMTSRRDAGCGILRQLPNRQARRPIDMILSPQQQPPDLFMLCTTSIIYRAGISRPRWRSKARSGFRRRMRDASAYYWRDEAVRLA